jgi:hypothetical protein
LKVRCRHAHAAGPRCPPAGGRRQEPAGDHRHRPPAVRAAWPGPAVRRDRPGRGRGERDPVPALPVPLHADRGRVRGHAAADNRGSRAGAGQPRPVAGLCRPCPVSVRASGHRPRAGRPAHHRGPWGPGAGEAAHGGPAGLRRDRPAGPGGWCAAGRLRAGRPCPAADGQRGPGAPHRRCRPGCLETLRGPGPGRPAHGRGHSSRPWPRSRGGPPRDAQPNSGPCPMACGLPAEPAGAARPAGAAS